MLRVVFERDSRHRLSLFLAEGHVEIPETSSDEYSLVCAAVSAVLQAARLGAETYAGSAVTAQQRSGRMEVRLPDAARDDVRVAAILETARLAVEQIAAQYPQHVSLLQREEA